MTLRERLRALASALPSDQASVTFSRADLLALAEGAGDEHEGETVGRPDLTVQDVADEVGRAPSTVRGWLIDGDIRGYKLNGRDWRVPPAALRDYLDRQREPAAEDQDEEGDKDPGVDIGAWRGIAP